MEEPTENLLPMEREERRRVFWSVYLLDKLVSCGKARPPAVADEDCHVLLPCDENDLRAGRQSENTSTLGQILRWNSDNKNTPGSFALVILATSVLGRCARYMLHDRSTDPILPWDVASEFWSLTSSLLLVESYLQVGIKPVGEILQGHLTADGMIDSHISVHVVFSHTIFHLSHCLLSHPFLLRQYLQRLDARAPSAFLHRAFRTSCEHAKHLSALLETATLANCRVESSFYSYAATIAAGILTLNSHFEQARGGPQVSELCEHTRKCLQILEGLSQFWDHAAKMVSCIQSFSKD